LIKSSRNYFLAALAACGCGVIALFGTAELATIRFISIVAAPVDRSADIFRDCPVCPQMLRVQPGQLEIGPLPGRRSTLLGLVGLRRSQTRIMTMAAPFAVGRYEVTFDEWDACVANGGCAGYRPQDEGWGRGTRPVIHVSWFDAQAYVNWLSAKTAMPYRLLTETEWEYAARAGSTSIYPWGNTASHERGNYGEDECCRGRVLGKDSFFYTAPVGRFPPNGFGLHDMIGNVYEWVEDCYSHILDEIPTDGTALKVEGCNHHVLRGAAWYSDPGRITSRYRAYQTPDRRDYVIGFRVARTIRE
jgi:formylglycine-generating enzyme required for sulfatase activity